MIKSPDTFPDKHPDAARTATIDWTPDLETEDTIATSTWSAIGPDSALLLTGPAIQGQVTAVRVAGGTLGAQYKITNRITTGGVPSKTLVSVKLINIRDDPR